MTQTNLLKLVFILLMLFSVNAESAKHPSYVFKEFFNSSWAKIQSAIVLRDDERVSKLVANLLKHKKTREHFFAANESYVWLALAELYRRLGRFDESDRCYRAFSKLGPYRVDPQIESSEPYQAEAVDVGTLKYPLEANGEVFWDAQQQYGLGGLIGLRKGRANIELVKNRALMGRYEKAVTLLKKGSKDLGFDSPQRKFLLGQLYYLKQDYAAALNSLLEAESFYLNPYYDDLAELYENQNQSRVYRYFYLLDPFTEETPKHSLVLLTMKEFRKVSLAGDYDMRGFDFDNADHRERYLIFLSAVYWKLGDQTKSKKVVQYLSNHYTTSLYRKWLQQL